MKKDERLVIRVSEENKNLLNTLCKEQGTDISKFVREMIFNSPEFKEVQKRKSIEKKLNKKEDNKDSNVIKLNFKVRL